VRAQWRALSALKGRSEDEAAKVALGLLAAHSLEKGARDKKGFGIGHAAIVRRAAIETLGTLTADACVEVLLGSGGVESRSWEVRSAALEAVGPVVKVLARTRLEDPLTGRCFAALLDGLADRDAIVRTGAATGLGASGHPRAGEHLAEALADVAWQVRLEAIRGLRALGGEAHIAALIGALGREHGRLQGEAEAALKALTGGDVGTDPELWQAWWDANKDRSRTERKAGGSHQTASRPRFYGITVDAERVSFVIDVTGSMHRFHEIQPALDWLAQDKDLNRPPYTGDTLMALAKYQLGNVIAEVPDTTWFNVILFSTSDIRGFEEQLVRATAPVRKKAQKFVAGMSWAGDTNLYDGALRALEQPSKPQKAFTEGPDTIYLFTDGFPNSGVLVEDDDIIDALEALCAFRRVRIHTVGLAIPPRRRRLPAQLAKRTGGRYVEVPVPIDQVRESQHSHTSGG